MVIQYPHKLFVWIQPDSSFDNSGDPILVDGSWENWGVCRGEPNTSAKVIQVEGAGSYGYSFVIYMPKTSKMLPVHTKVKIEFENRSFETKVAGWSNGQLNTRLWV